MKHTKGKWKLDKSGVATAIKSGDVFVASVYNQDRRIEGKNILDADAYDTSETDANASLIALAPEMLDMLKEICYAWKGNQLLIDDSDINREMLILIAKAEGEIK